MNFLKTRAGKPEQLDRISKASQFCLHTCNEMPFAPSFAKYHISVSHSARFVWFRVAKNGTRSIYQHLNKKLELEAQHPSNVYFAPWFYRKYFKFAMVRNPWDRLVSCWLNKVVEANYFGFSPLHHNEMQSFEKFVAYLKKLDVENCNRHLKLQSRLINLQHVDFIGRMERFTQDFTEICVKLGIDLPAGEAQNQSVGRRHYHEYYSPELVCDVAQIYREDIDLFDYQFDVND